MYAACDNPLFIIGTERSGSNLLRLILNMHSAVAIPHPPHIMRFFSPLVPYYGDLQRDENFRELTSDVLKLVASHIHPWQQLPTVDSLMARAPRDLFGLMSALYEYHLGTTGKVRWGCKSTFMIHHVRCIRARYPRAKLLWLVRDPRDVALSSRNSVFNPYHPYFTATLWHEQQRIGLALHEETAGSMQRIHYEQLVRDPDRTVRQVCDFLDLPFEAAMLRYFDSDEARTASALATDWSNVAQPIQAAKAQRFARELTAEHLRIVEQVSSPLMQELGYEITQPRPLRGRPSAIHKLKYRLANEARRLLVEYRSLRHNRNHARRWARALRIASLEARLKLRQRVRQSLASQPSFTGWSDGERP